MFALSWKAGLAGTMFLAATAYAFAEMPGHQGHGPAGHTMSPGSDTAGMDGCPVMKGGGMHGKHGMHGMMRRQDAASADLPSLPGHAFGAIQEVVRLLEADPATNWSKVDIGPLREHLIDMDEVTLDAVTDEKPLDNGIEILVTGEGRTADAIKRMVPAHAHALSATGWNAKTEDLPNGVKLVVTSDDPAQATRLKALSFMGIMVQGSHHQMHHLMMAKGEFAY